MYWVSDEYENLAETVIDEHPDLRWIRSSGVRIGYLESDKAKMSAAGPVLGECTLVKELYRPYCPHDFLIIIYLPNCERLTLEQAKILLYHELLHVDMSEKDGGPRYRVAPHDVQDFRAVIDRYGFDWSGR